jgi:hypothetical protein
MARMRTGALRKLHADLGQILADYDASCAEQAAAADEDDSDNDAPAMDSAAPRGTASMRAAFGPNWNRVNNR